MNYTQWAKLHPKQTLGYIRIQCSIKEIQQKIEKYNERLQNVQQGVIPPLSLYAGWTPIFVEIAYKKLGYSEDVIAQKVQEESAKQQREDENRSIEREIKWCVEQKAKEESLLADLKAKLVAYTVVDENRHLWVNSDSALGYSLCSRLACLPMYTFANNKHIPSFTNYEGVIKNVDGFLDLYRENDIPVQFSLKYHNRRSWWIASMGDDAVAATRADHSALTAILRTWITYLDLRWDTLMDIC